MVKLDLNSLLQKISGTPENRDSFLPPTPRKVNISTVDSFSSGEDKPAATVPSKETGWLRKILERPKVLREAQNLISEIDTFPHRNEEELRSFFDIDLPRLITIGNRHPEQVHAMLENARAQSQNSKTTEAWYRLIQVACGDHRATLPALESLC